MVIDSCMFYRSTPYERQLDEQSPGLDFQCHYGQPSVAVNSLPGSTGLELDSQVQRGRCRGQQF